MLIGWSEIAKLVLFRTYLFCQCVDYKPRLNIVKREKRYAKLPLEGVKELCRSMLRSPMYRRTYTKNLKTKLLDAFTFPFRLALIIYSAFKVIYH